jgi:hypothetical protein
MRWINVCKRLLSDMSEDSFQFEGLDEVETAERSKDLLHILNNVCGCSVIQIDEDLASSLTAVMEPYTPSSQDVDGEVVAPKSARLVRS